MKLNIDKLYLIVTYKKKKKTEPYSQGRLLSSLDGRSPIIPRLKRSKRKERGRRRGRGGGEYCFGEDGWISLWR